MKSNVKVKLDHNSNGDVPDLIKAAYDSDYPKIQQLLESGVDVNSVDPRDNLTCLHIGCMNGDEPLVDLILAWDQRHGDVDFSIKSAFRPRTAWQYAMNAHRYELAHKVDAAGLAKTGRGPADPSP